MTSICERGIELQRSRECAWERRALREIIFARSRRTYRGDGIRRTWPRDLPRSDRTRERIGTDTTTAVAVAAKQKEKEREWERGFFSRARTGIVFSASFLAAESAAADREHSVPATSKTRAGTVWRNGAMSRVNPWAPLGGLSSKMIAFGTRGPWIEMLRARIRRDMIRDDRAEILSVKRQMSIDKFYRRNSFARLEPISVNETFIYVSLTNCHITELIWILIQNYENTSFVMYD